MGRRAHLGRYTHRVAISNDRLVGLDDGRVRFRWRDYADGDRVKLMELEVDEFLRRFLLHIVPDGFVRIRHFGLLANRRRRAALAQCRALFTQPPPPVVAPESVRALMLRVTGIDIARCPVCQDGCLRQVTLPRGGHGTLPEPPPRAAGLHAVGDGRGAAIAPSCAHAAATRPAAPDAAPTNRPRRRLAGRRGRDAVLPRSSPPTVPASSQPAATIESPYVMGARGLVQLVLSAMRDARRIKA